MMRGWKMIHYLLHHSNGEVDLHSSEYVLD
jgi:hypothetical protein